jgi:hypothetical protein
MGKQDDCFEELLHITQDFVVLAGYTQWRVAKRNKRATLPCLQCTVTDEEAIIALLHGNQRRSGLNGYCRILVALELESWLTELAWANQKIGGRSAGPRDHSEFVWVNIALKLENGAERLFPPHCDRGFASRVLRTRTSRPLA